MPDCRILYIEDDVMMPELVTELFESAGIQGQITVVGDRESFLRACDDDGFDVVLSDHDVPGLPGIVALRELRNRLPDIPFVFVCGVGGEEREVACFEAGANDFVQKDQLFRLPLVMRRLLSGIERDRVARELTSEREALDLLVRAVKQLSMARSLQQIAEVVRTVARKFNGADGATFVLRDGDLCHYFDEDAISPLWKGLRFPQSTCISGWVMQHGTPAVIEDIYQDPRIPADAYRPTFVHSLVMVPVRAEAPIAAIGNYWAKKRLPTANEISHIQALADATSVAMENVEVYAELERRVRDRTAQLEVINRELEAFSYSVSHDLRTPVGQAMGFAELLARDLGANATAKQQRFISNIIAAGRRTIGLIDDLLRLGQVSRAALKPSKIDIGELARSIVDDMQLSLAGRSIEWRLGNDIVVYADAGLVRSVLENLLSNAVKYSSKLPHAIIEVGCQEVTESEIVCFVRDDGAGFDSTQAQRLFTPFGRLHAATDFPGTGVGLATCQRIVHRHGGRIWAESSVGNGACFYFSFPPLAAGTRSPTT